jgi:poly(3-hydroxybutyrate) depolymerase
MSIFRPEFAHLLFTGGNQPARRDFAIDHVTPGDVSFAVRTRDAAVTPFCTLIEFSLDGHSPPAALLVAAPLSGHFPVLLRDLVIGFLPFFRVYITDWNNFRHVPAAYGSFGLDANISCVLEMIKGLAPGLNVIGICQGGVAALAATAILARRGDERTPANLILMAAPIDPLANPTRVVQLLRSKPLSWFEDHLIDPVSEEYAGSGRRVYPAGQHLIPLWLYLSRHLSQGGELAGKVLLDDGTDPDRFPFLDLYSSMMDLDARFFLENTKSVFHDCLLRERELRVHGECADPCAIENTSLLTIEGERDDIAAPGQTSAAHALCSSIPEHRRRELVVPACGHFSLFHGETWRRQVLPQVLEFCGCTTPGLG